MFKKLGKVALLSILVAGSLKAYMSEEQCAGFKEIYKSSPSSYQAMYVDNGLCKSEKQINNSKGMSKKSKELFSNITMGNYMQVLDKLNEGTNVNSLNMDGNSPLMVALSKKYSDMDIVNLLIERKSNVDYISPKKESALFISIYHNNYKAVKALIKAGVNVNLKIKDGYTPLFIANGKGHHKIVELLIANGADINIKNKNSLSYNDVVSSLKKKYIGHSFKIKHNAPVCHNDDNLAILSNAFYGYNKGSISYKSYMEMIYNGGCFTAGSKLSKNNSIVLDVYKQSNQKTFIIKNSNRKLYVSNYDVKFN